MRALLILAACALLLTGCHTYIQAPGAVGKIVDADTGAPVHDAHITRPFLIGGLGGRLGIPPDGLPLTTASSDKNGRFNLAPATKTEIAFMYLHNPKSISGVFIVSADGYVTNELRGVATAHGLWRADLGKVLLKKP